MKQFYRIFWIGVYAAIAAVGARTIGRPESALALKDLGRDGSVNTVLERTLNQPKASKEITDWLAGLPSGRPVLVVVSPDSRSATITADLISYLAWPRTVDVSSDPAKSIKLLDNAREHYCAVGLCYLQLPPDTKIVKSFGRALTFISTEAGQP